MKGAEEGGAEARCQARCRGNERLRVHFCDDETRGIKRVAGARENAAAFKEKAYIERCSIGVRPRLGGGLSDKGREGATQ